MRRSLADRAPNHTGLATRVDRPIVGTEIQTVRISSHASFYRDARSPNRSKLKIPIARYLGLAGSDLPDFRTPAGARCSSGKQTGRFREVRW